MRQTQKFCLRLEFAAVLLPVLLSTLATAQEQPQLSPEKRAQIEAAVSKFMASTHVPGLSVAVVENGAYEWASGFGLADAENNAPASEYTLFRLASISKSLTATAAMQLEEQGKLDLDAPVQKYCPAFPPKPWPITTRQVMGHLAGIRHYKGGPDDLEIGNTKHFDSPIQAGLDFFKNEALLSEPGKTFHYSTQGYTLGCMVNLLIGKRRPDSRATQGSNMLLQRSGQEPCSLTYVQKKACGHSFGYCLRLHFLEDRDHFIAELFAVGQLGRDTTRTGRFGA